MEKSGRTRARLCLLGLLAAGAVSALPVPAGAMEMSSLDRRLNVAVLGFAFSQSAAEEALRAGADINHRNDALNNDTLLIDAIRGFKDVAVIRWLLAHGADPGLANDQGRTALSFARQLMSGSASGRAIIAQLEGARASASASGAAPNGASIAPPRLAPRTPQQFAAAPGNGRQAMGPPASGGMGGPPPQPGVYECINQAAVRTPMSFGIIDGRTFMTSTGRTGHYTYNSGTGILVLTQGGESARFQRAGPTWFRPIRAATGQLGGFTCPLNRTKDPRRPTTW